MRTISRVVKFEGSPQLYAVACDDGNTERGEIGASNLVTLLPASKSVGTPVTIDSGWYRVRTNRLLAQGTQDNTDAKMALAAVVAHINSEYLGKRPPTLGSASLSGKSAKLGTGYIGLKVGRAVSPGGWTLVYFPGL